MDVTCREPGGPWGSAAALRRWAWASLIANMVLIVTGAIVRLTDSGLGCPTWPHCTAGSFVPRGQTTIHSAIEFGNRTLTFVLVALAVCTLVATYRTASDTTTRSLAWVAVAGIPFQGVIGGITVLTKLNPYVVALHLLLSVALIVVAVKLVLHVTGRAVESISRGAHSLVVATFTVGMVVTWLGTLVTGSGPNSGDHGAARTGLDIESVARGHAGAVWLLVIVTIASVWALRRQAKHHAFPVALLLLGVEACQGVVGYVQYFTHLPTELVIWHMVGVSVFTAVAAWLLFSVRRTTVD